MFYLRVRRYMVKVDRNRYRVYFERAIDCYNSILILQTIYYDTDVKPDYLKEYNLKNFDVIFMLFSISVISLVNCLTVKNFGEKAKDHTDLSYYKRLKQIMPEMDKFDNLVFDINNIKNSSEYGDKHYLPTKTADIKILKKFLEFVEDKIE